MLKFTDFEGNRIVQIQSHTLLIIQELIRLSTVFR